MFAWTDGAGMILARGWLRARLGCLVLAWSRLRLRLERLGRLFWFTVEFGVIRQNGEIKVYGSGLISSHGECTHVINAGPEIREFNLAKVLDTVVDVAKMQPVLYAIESFDQIYEATKEAESRLG